MNGEGRHCKIDCRQAYPKLLYKSLKTKVLYTGEVFVAQQFGGISRYVVELLSALTKEGEVDISLFAPIYVNDYLYEAKKVFRHRGIHMRKFRGLPRVFSAIEQVAEKIRRTEPAIIHTSFYNERALRSCVTSKKISTFYDMIDERFDRVPVFQAKKEKVFKLSDRCIAISQSTKSDMVEFYNADPEKIDVVYLATSFPLLDRSPNQPKDYLLWVGDRHTYKNFSNFVRAFSISRARREGVRVICAGGVPLRQEELHEWNSVGLKPEQLSYVRPTDDQLQHLYAHALALVYVSAYEGFGIPPLEAMRCNCPVIVSNSSSLPEVVGNAAEIVDASDTDAMAVGLDHVVYDGAVREKLIEHGRVQSAKFSWERCASETLECYRKVLQT